MVLQRPIPGTGGCLSHATKEKRPRSVTTLSRRARRFFWEQATLSQKKRTPLAGGFHSPLQAGRAHTLGGFLRGAPGQGLPRPVL